MGGWLGGEGSGVGGQGLPQWAPLAGGALVLGYLLLRSKGAGTAQPAAAKDPLSAAAQQLQSQNAQADAQRQNALANLAAADQGAKQQYDFGVSLISKGGNNPLIGCPGGGEARFVPNPGSPLGWSWECIPRSPHSGGFFGQLLSIGQTAFNDFLSFTRIGSPAVGTPPIAGGGPRAYPAQASGDTSGNYPPGYVQTSI